MFGRFLTLFEALPIGALVVCASDVIGVIDKSVNVRTVVGVAVDVLREFEVGAIELVGDRHQCMQYDLM
ncbi:MAG: hypothetical protein ABJP22_13880 [Hyphomicrobiales bacterium]